MRPGTKRTIFRWAAALLAAALLIACLTGCGKQAEVSESVREEQTTASAREVPTETAPPDDVNAFSDGEEPTETASPDDEEPEKTPDAAVTEPTDDPENVSEGTLTTEEEVCALLDQCRQTGAAEIEFTCSEALFKNLMADGFSQLSILMVKSGVDGDVWYSLYAKQITLKDVVYPDRVLWAECTSEMAVKNAVLQFGEEEQAAFTLICPPELAKSMRSFGKLQNFAAQGGYYSISVRGSGSLVEVSDCKPFDEPYAVVEDAAQFSAAVEKFAQQKLTSFYIVREQKYYEHLKEDSLSALIMVSSSMLDTYAVGSTSSGIYHYTDVTYTSDPKMICYTEDDVLAAIRQMGAIGATSFHLYLVGELIEPLSADSFKRLHKLEAEAGMTSSRMAYSFSDKLRELAYSEASIVADAVALDTMEDAISYVDEKVRSGAQEITLFCSEDLYTELIGSLDTVISLGKDGMTPIYDLVSQAGIYDYELISSRVSHAITIHVTSLYPGIEILLAVHNGAENTLSERLRQTLAKARAIVDACSAKDPLALSRELHDAVCALVTYETVEDRSENDTAIGVLLNGRADCDGYSDAFYLVGNLAGLNIRYQHGKGVNNGFYGFLDSTTHMWNLIKLDGTWRMVDVTWDDSGDEIRYSWFNLGYDRASRDHRWNEKMTVGLLEKTDLSARPDNEFSVTSADELQEAIEAAFAGKYPCFMLVFDSEGYVEKQEALNRIGDRFGGSILYSWNEEMRMLTVYIG